MAGVLTFDPFEALGLERDATPKSIKETYYDLARRYHPNRNQGSDESQAALSEHFYHIHQAWRSLCDADKRRRCIEWLQLLDQQDAVLTSCSDLFGQMESTEQLPDSKRSAPEEHISSDADEDDEDLPRAVGVRRRDTFDKQSKRSAGGLKDAAEGSDSTAQGSIRGRRGKARFPKLKSSGRSGKEEESSDNNTAAERRRKLDKLRRKEFDAFDQYRDAMFDKFDAEATAEICREQFEQAQWRRQYFERAPKEISQRVRLTQLMSNAIKALTTQRPIRTRNRGSTAGIPNSALTPIEPSETNQFLNLPSRTKTFHRRGYSSDISGDQTSSDENSSDKQTSPSRSPRLGSRPLQGKHRRLNSGTLPPLPIPQRCLPNGNHDPVSPITGPGPRLLVRAPTARNEIFDIQGSDVDSASASSRSPSPQPAPAPKEDPSKFVLVPANGSSEVFDTEHDRRARSRSADRRSVSRNGTRTDSRAPAQEASLFRIKQVGHWQNKYILMEHVHELNATEKQWMLGVEPDADMDPAVLLNAVSALDENVAELLAVKQDIKQLFNFRLIYSHREVVKQQHQTFIALSYRRKLHVEKKGQKHNRYYTLPLGPEMFQAVWDERISDNEGVWIDQICIDGDSEQEKTVSMSAMDMVYRSARLVVVALDDVELEAYEGGILENHMQDFERQVHIPPRKRFTRRQKPYLEANEDLFRVIRKLMRSSWFRRAWCRHEMRLAREHIFLVPCRTPGSWSGTSVLRFTGKCLTHFLSLATEVPFEPEIESVKPALYAFFRDRSKLAEHDHHLQRHHGNFTTVVAEVFAMEAGGDPRIPEEQRSADARKDKISIILNTMECGLALDQKARNTNITLPTHQCNYMLLLMALAARDPGALGSVGQPLRPLPYNLTSSWLFEPTNVDSGLNNYRTLNRLPESSKITAHYQDGEHYVQLGLKFLKTDTALHPSESPETVTLAKHFIDVCDERELGRNRKRYLLDNQTMRRLFGDMRDVYVETLVCVFECGPDWMSDVCQRYGVSRWRNDLQPAYDLLVALKNTFGRWPDSAWSNQAAGFIMDFVNFMIIRGMPQRHISQPEKWRPVWAPTPGGGKLLTFSPSGDIRVAVPSALLDIDYIHLARMWILQPRGEHLPEEHGHHNREWTLLGKSILFSDDIASDLLEAHSGMIHGGQKVFGRGAKSSKTLQIPHPRRG